ncbi:MAG TPA: histidine ammonia-lyase [Anaerolineales bacterium]|nr:histidine ammonia-lyase [Anaerolineales bacterium]
MTINLDGESLTIEQVVSIARGNAELGPLSGEVIEAMMGSQAWVERTVSQGKAVIYGVNTGFGPLATTSIPARETSQLSRNVILNCACGVGSPLPIEIVRAMMVIRVNTLAKGVSGIRTEMVDALIAMVNRGVTPYVPSKGSLGASGDLAPLAHIAIVLTRDPEPGDGGESGKAWHQGELLSGDAAMERAGIPRLIPQAKEGLALTNGTTFMVAAGAFGIYDGISLLRHAEIAAALSLEASLALTDAFHPALHELSNQPGQIRTAANLRALLEESLLVDTDKDRIQDAYSLRCIPQVLGPARDTLDFLRERFVGALNAATDNPLIVPDPSKADPWRALSGGNFHGQGPALWLDMLSIAIAEIGSIAERRIFRLLTPELSAGLPSMLVPTSGLDSGLMVPQYTAAALVSDNKTLAHPDSVDSIPSSGNQEDHVSMGPNAARHTLEILDNVRTILAIELLTACQAVDLRPDGPARLGRGTAAAYRLVRSRVPILERDRSLSPDIERLVELIASEEILAEVEGALGIRL